MCVLFGSVNMDIKRVMFQPLSRLSIAYVSVFKVAQGEKKKELTLRFSEYHLQYPIVPLGLRVPSLENPCTRQYRRLSAPVKQLCIARSAVTPLS